MQDVRDAASGDSFTPGLPSHLYRQGEGDAGDVPDFFPWLRSGDGVHVYDPGGAISNTSCIRWRSCWRCPCRCRSRSITMVLLREPLNIYAIFGLFMLFRHREEERHSCKSTTRTPLRAGAWTATAPSCRPSRAAPPILMTMMIAGGSMIRSLWEPGPVPEDAPRWRRSSSAPLLCLLLTLW